MIALVNLLQDVTLGLSAWHGLEGGELEGGSKAGSNPFASATSLDLCCTVRTRNEGNIAMKIP